MPYQQEPMAIVGLACRLPGGNHSPWKLQSFLEKGGVAPNHVPASRFNIRGHYDGSEKPGTMRPPGGMFLGDIDLASFDPGFFELSGLEAIAMDPNQRQMLEVVVEGLENAGIPLERVNGAPVACFVGSYASVNLMNVFCMDYGDMHNRDPEDRPANYPIGVGRAILANRISYCLNLKGPSITIDTACSGSLVGADLACRMIQSGEVDTAIVAASNFYLNPDHTMDIGSVGQAHSPIALCHVFDASADGYVKAEAVSCVIIKRLADAIRDRDPVRAVIRGTASTSNGRTGGIASPNWEAQAEAIRRAYENAGISELNKTTYLECHGTGTQAGDVAEVKGVGSVFAGERPADNPLLIGSVKSNIGHSEPAAGLSGLIKVVSAMETGIIPGTPLFKVPNPNIDFSGNRVKVSRTNLPWPDTNIRRASINSFGFGGSNAHAIVDQAGADIRRHYVRSCQSAAESPVWESDDEYSNPQRPQVVILSANDAVSLEANIAALCDHLNDPRVQMSSLPDLAYTLSERRSRFWHRAFATISDMELNENDFTVAKRGQTEPRIGFVFTGQGAQWPQMGRTLVEHFPRARSILEELDASLQSMSDPPSWSLLAELTEERTSEHLRRPEMSQPLVTALQLCMVEILRDWGIEPCSVIGHSSGEIAAAYSAGLLDRPSALRAAYYRGQAAVDASQGKGKTHDMGMLAIGLSAESAAPFLAKFEGRLSVSCYNSPESLTISGHKADLEALNQELKTASHFSRLLHVDVAYHSPLVEAISERYLELLDNDAEFAPTENFVQGTHVYSTVTASRLDTLTDSRYWKSNMNSPVRFEEALKTMVSDADSPNILIEIGPSGALAGPISQTLKHLDRAKDISYYPSWSRNGNASKTLFDLAGHLYTAGSPINFSRVNEYDEGVRTIVDLPNYRWNHTVKYWHENESSRQWRFKKFPTHDLIGSKTLSSSWHSPVWHKQLLLEDVPWLRDHKMGTDILIPGAGLATMALEAMYQKHTAFDTETTTTANDLCYRFRNVLFDKAVVVEEDKRLMIILSLSPVAGSKEWHEFQIRTMTSGVETLHCSGLIRVQDPLLESISGDDLMPLSLPQTAESWYKAQAQIGMGFGPAFRNIQSIESSNGTRSCRSLVSLTAPASKWMPQSYYPIHPAILDSMLGTGTPANACGDRSSIQDVMVPSMVDDMVINPVPSDLAQGLSLASSVYSGRGRLDLAKNWTANISIHDPQTGNTLIRVRNLRYIKLDVIKTPDPHRFNTVSWKPDISLLNQDHLLRASPNSNSTDLDHIIDIVCHKNPTLSVLEVNLSRSDPLCLWFGATDFSARVAHSRYGFASSSAKVLVAAQEQYESRPNTTFHLSNHEHKGLGISDEVKYDLAIVRIPPMPRSTVDAVLDGIRSLLSNGAFILLVATQVSAESLNGVTELLTTENTNSSSSWLPQELADAFSGVVFIGSTTSTGTDLSSPGAAHMYKYIGKGNQPNGVHEDPWSVHVVSFSKTDPYSPEPGFSASLSESGFTVSSPKDISEVHGPKSIALVTDELSHAVLRSSNEEKWEILKSLLSSGIPILWVTKGAQLDVTNPDSALVQGLFRVVRREDPTARLTTLDMSSDCSDEGAWWSPVVQVLGQIRRGAAEAEYAERQGVLHVGRIMPDAPLNEFKRTEEEGVSAARGGLFSTPKRVQLMGERVGTLDMAWHETDAGEPPELDEHWIEVEVVAIGINFKDVVTSMGLVPENEYALGCECAGVVTRLGSMVTKFQPGDRVVVLRNATFANRCRVPEARAQLIPSWMNFDLAATIPVAYCTSILSMFHLGNLRKGQSILIHSAAGGVGLAAIDLARYVGAEVFATVGNEDKKNYLMEKCDLPSERIFNSRSIDFADQITRVTKGRGVDLVLNSLTGDLLDASWRICADGGTLVEIGKKDMVARNKLSMEPFDRGCSYRPVDLSDMKVVSDALIERLLKETFDLIEGGNIKPTHPLSTYTFDAIPNALVRLRSGDQIGKMVISRTNKETDVEVPIKRMLRVLQLRSDVSYLIIGGLRGLCGSLAVHMARHGARHVIVYNRSGCEDDESSRVIRDCAVHGCSVLGIQNDIRDIEAVRRAVSLAEPPIGGVIQGAMVLRDKPFEAMGVDDYHAAVDAKVQGTWNIHHALQEAGQKVDFFTMLSSVSGVIGNKGQANYASANTFLDAFASYRQGMGLAANSVDLGVIQDVGYVAQQGGALEERFDKSGWTPLNERMLRKVLSYSIMQQDFERPINMDTRAQLITGIGNISRGSKGLSDLVTDPRFAYLNGSHDAAATDVSMAGADGEDGKRLEQAIRAFRVTHAAAAAAGSPEQKDVAKLVTAGVEVLAAQIAKVLRLEVQIEPAKPPSTYGLDSLSATELRGWVRVSTGAELSTLDITNASSLVELSKKLVAKMPPVVAA